MYKRVCLIILLVFFVNYIFGCTKVVKKDVQEINLEKSKIVEIVLLNGNVIKYGHLGGRYIPEEDAIICYDEEDRQHKIGLDEILYVKIRKTDKLATALTYTLVIGLAVALIVIISSDGDDEPYEPPPSDGGTQSCPFVYSYDGEKYLFDAEPLGGAICKMLERTEYSRLEHLKSSGGRYKILVRNEVKETQYLDELKLAVIDHEPSRQVVTDWFGNMYLINQPLSPVSATDENNHNLMKFFEENDGLHWQSKLPSDDSFLEEDTRHHITVKFPKPEDVEQANLVVNAGTALWGSNMIRKMLESYGDGLDAWYDNVNSGGTKLMEMFYFNLREELYMLKVHVKQGDQWIERGIIPGGGPLITESRLIELDVSDIPGDTLTIKINPPKGFWALDYLAVDYNEKTYPEINELDIYSAKDMSGNDILPLLAVKDSGYYLMPKLNQWASVEFTSPPETENTARSVFLKSSGYYEIQIDKTLPEQTELIAKILATPGEIVMHSLSEYLKLYDGIHDYYKR